MSRHNSDRPGETNRPDTFQHLQSTFTSTHRARPPVMEFFGEHEEKRVPLKANKNHQQESKSGLRAIFTRNKADKNVGLPVIEGSSNDALSEKPKTAIERSNTLKKLNTLPVPTSTTPRAPQTTSKPSRMNLRSKSVKYSKPAPKSSPKLSTMSAPKLPTRTSATWDPPPLFQAYPQAIKHATLIASTLSADSILRISSQDRTNSVRDDLAQSRPEGGGPDQTPAAKKAEKAKSKHRRQVSGSISKADWTQKIFVLVTSGYLLQYAGEGSFDRLPEKMMQLGKDSVAFASDVIPGKHWVLQISQSMNADGTPTADPRSLFSRLTFRGVDYRRTATSLLLVLNSAEDMDSWIAVVRREIEALGGKKHVSETGKPKPDEKVMQLKAQPIHRYLIQRGAELSNTASPSSPSSAPPWTKDAPTQDILEDAASASNRPLSTTRPSTGHQSTSNSIMSRDGRQLDNLRDSTNRLSFMSSGQRTLITSQSSSPTTSPVRESFPSFDELHSKNSIDDAQLRPNAAAINERRGSMQTMQNPLLDAPPQPQNYRHSTYDARPFSRHSPTLNFSTPKRSSRVLIPEAPPIPNIFTTTPTPNNPLDSILEGSRKGPPVSLQTARPLSALETLASPSMQSPGVFTPTESSFRMVQLTKASVVSIPPRTPTASCPISPVDLSHGMSTFMPVVWDETAHVDLQSPKRYSSIRTLGDPVHLAPQEPAGPAALTTPLPISPYFPGDECKIPYSHDTTEIEIEKESLPPLPVLANSKQKLRRPTSMLIQPSTTPSRLPTRSPRTPLISSTHRLSTLAPSTRSSSLGATSPAAITVISPSFHRLKVQAHPKAVGNRKSMPALANGPPPAPPPDCALPPLPSPGGAGLRIQMGTRSSIRA